MPSNKEIVLDAVDALNKRDFPRVAQYWTSETVEYFPDAVCRGAAEIQAYFEATYAAVPDLQLDIQACAADGDDVFLHWIGTGTHDGGPFNGLNPTGKSIRITGMDHFVLKDGLIVSNTVVFDGMDIGRQMGVMPPDGSAADKAMKAAFNALTAARNKVKAAR